MAFQTAANVLVALKRETVTGVAATAAGATQVRITDSPGLELKRSPIQSEEKRSDALNSMGRLGGKMVDGSYNMEITSGGAFDILLEALMRSTFATATVVTWASVTTVALNTNTVTAGAAADWFAQGFRTGDIFTITGTTVSANNNLRVPILSMTTTVLTVPPATFTTLAATVTGTITRLKKVINGATPVNYSHTVEQYDKDIDLTELFLGVRVVSLKLSAKPNQMATAEWTLMGMDRTALATGTSPWFSSPTLTTGIGMIADDSAIFKDGVAVTSFTGIDLTFEIQAKGEPVIGSFVTPDIFLNDMNVSGSITGLRQDFANITSFDAETEFQLLVLFKELMTAPVNCLSVYLPRLKFSALSAPFGGGDGAKIETLTLMVGPKAAATGFDATVASFCSSAA